jgi:hypothetical protein
MDPATSNTVIAIATAVNVVVTTIYAIFTWRLWQETRRQAGLTGQQAAQTREMFEATHRPWISIEPFRQYDFSTSSVGWPSGCGITGAARPSSPAGSGGGTSRPARPSRWPRRPGTG